MSLTGAGGQSSETRRVRACVVEFGDGNGAWCREEERKGQVDVGVEVEPWSCEGLDRPRAEFGSWRS